MVGKESRAIPAQRGKVSAPPVSAPQLTGGVATTSTKKFVILQVRAGGFSVPCNARKLITHITGRILQIKDNGQILIWVVNADIVSVTPGSSNTSVERNGNPQLLPQEAYLMHISKIGSNLTLQKKSTFWLCWLPFTCPEQEIPCSRAKSRRCASFESGGDRCVFKGEAHLGGWGRQEPASLCSISAPRSVSRCGCGCCRLCRRLSSPLPRGGCALWWSLRFGHCGTQNPACAKVPVRAAVQVSRPCPPLPAASLPRAGKALHPQAAAPGMGF